MKQIGFIITLVFLFNFSGYSSIKTDRASLLAEDKNDTLTLINKTEEAWTYYEKGLNLHDSGNYLSAETAFLQTIDVAEKSNEKELLAYSYHYLGRIERWKSNYSKSIQYHTKAKGLFHNLRNSKYTAISNNQISLGFDALGDYDSSVVYYKKNIENRENVDFKYTILFSYKQIAKLFATLYNYKEAYSYLQEGIEYAEETESTLSLAELYLTAGVLFLNNHVNKDIALEYLLEARTLFMEMDDWRNIQWTNISIGDAYSKIGNDSLAMLYYKNVAATNYEANYSSLSRANHRIGMVYKNKIQYDSALVYLQKGIDVMCKVCPEISIHNTLLQTADVYLKKSNTNQAFVYLKRARDIAMGSNSGLEIARSDEELAKYFQTIHKRDSAIHYLMSAHEQAKKLGLLEITKRTAESLSAVFYSNKDFKASSDYLKIANEMNDSLASIETYKEIAKLEMRFEMVKNEQERILKTQALQNEISKQKLIRNSSIIGAILSLLIGVLLLRAYRSKRKDNQLLTKQKQEIQEISRQLQESGKRKLDFFTNISHEIRTPLTLIKSPLERILKSGINDDLTNKQLQLALNNTNKLKSLVNQILDLQKLDEHQLSLNVSDFDILAFCTEIVSSFEGYCYQTNCTLNFESNIGKAIINFDQGRLQSIIHNLLSNAFKFNKENGSVEFKLEVHPQHLKLEISDTGKGIANEHLNKLGERYYQVEKPNSTIEGTGIGLAYVKELVELMNGKLNISSAINKGTSVTISLPCNEIKIQIVIPVKLQIKPQKQIFDQLEEQVSDNIENGQPRVLIIEDNYELRSFLCDLFTPHYQVICAKDGLEGKDMALKHIPDLIISDVMMPRIRGNELCKMLKNDVNTSHITVILFTAKGAPDSIVDGYDCGADDYIVKPFDFDLLLKKVKNIISTGENARKQFSFADIERSNGIYSDFDKKFLKDCMSIIKENIGNSNFTVESLAESIHIHRRTLLRKFKALSGKSPIDLIKHTRMSHAADLIKNKKYRVNEVALMVGYEDANRFSQAFKQHHGMSPSAIK